MININKNVYVIIAIIIILIIVLLVAGSYTGYIVSSAPSPSNCSGVWNSCTYAFADDSSRASANVKDNLRKTAIFRTYRLSLPAGATIDSVVIRADFFATKPTGYVDIAVSGNAGFNLGPNHRIGGNTAERSYYIDVTNDLAWTPEKLNKSNLWVYVTCLKQGNGSNPTCRLDWIPIYVNFTNASERVDNDADGYDSAADCNDNNANIHPNASELCNNLDDDCDGQIDENLQRTETCGTGACLRTVNQTCSAGQYAPACSPGTPGTETCNNLDDDCDGQTDEGCANQTFNFSLSIIPTSGSVEKGKSITSDVFVDLLSSSTQQVSLSFSGCPADASCSFNVTSGSPTFSSSLRINTTSSTRDGSYPITITGTGGGLTRTASFALTVVNATNGTNATFDFSLSPSPSSGSVSQGNNITSNVTVRLVSGSAQPVNLAYSGCPTGATCSFSPASGSPTYSSTFRVSTATSTPAGTYPITLTGTGGGTTRSSTFTLTITEGFDFNVSASPSLLFGVIRGQKVSSNITVSLLRGTTQQVNLSFTGCPSGSSCSLTRLGGDPTFSSTLYVNTTNSTSTGLNAVNVTGRSGERAVSVLFELIVS